MEEHLINTKVAVARAKKQIDATTTFVVGHKQSKPVVGTAVILEMGSSDSSMPTDPTLPLQQFKVRDTVADMTIWNFKLYRCLGKMDATLQDVEEKLVSLEKTDMRRMHVLIKHSFEATPIFEFACRQKLQARSKTGDYTD